MKKEIPILFSTPMVQAILDGRKTMTRRVNGLDTVNSYPDEWVYKYWAGSPFKNFSSDNASGVDYPRHQFIHKSNSSVIEVKCPYGQPGDILWVRENFKMTGWHFEDSTAVIEFCTGESQEFETTDGDTEAYDWIVKQFEKLLSKDIIEPGEEEEGPMKFTGKNHPWSPSIHIPKWCSRIWLEVIDVRVERLQDMDGAHAEECDSLKEGIMKFHHGDGNYGYHWKGDMDGKNFVHPFDAFVDLWKSINGPESWDANPWVWVVSFKVLSTTGRPEFKPTPIASPGEGAVVVEGVKPEIKTVGQLLTEAFTLNELKAEVVEMELGFPAGMITKLMNDEFYTNSVPIILFKNLIESLHIRPSEVYKAMIPTFNVVLAKETPETIKKKPHGYQMWENKDAVKKYTERLKHLIANGTDPGFDIPESKLHLPSRGIDGHDENQSMWDEFLMK